MSNGLGSTRNFPKLTKLNIREIFSHVYEGLEKTISENIKITPLNDFIRIVVAYSEFVRNHRGNEKYLMYSLAKEVMGDFEINSEGTDMWMSMLIAMEELYQLSRAELINMLHKAKGMQ